MSLVRTSDFCQRPNASQREVPVLLEFSGNTLHDNSFPHIAWVTTELLKQLGTVVGRLGRLRYGTLYAVVKLDLIGTATPRRNDTDASAVGIRGLTAHQIGWKSSRNNKNISTEASLQLILPSSLQTARTVTLCPLARLGRTEPVLPRPGTILHKGALVPIIDRTTLHWYHVETVDENDGAYKTTKSTFYKLLSPIECPQLPGLSQASDELTNAPDSVNLPPHPDVPQWVERFRTAGTSLPERMWHVVANDEEHSITTAIETAADRAGRRCLTILGLAATAYQNGITVSTGQWVDKLAGLQAALTNAAHQVPSVLLFLDIDREFSLEDSVREVEESRFWNTIAECLHKHTLVVLSTRYALKPGPILENLVFHDIQPSLPDGDYVQYLWTEPNDNILHSVQLETVVSLMKGRPYREIIELRQDFMFAPEDKDRCGGAVERLENLCASKDADRRKKSGLGKIPCVHWEDVGGLVHVRREIMDAIELPLYHPEMFASSHGRSGILLFGPPGTGKTLVAKAVATECALPFLSVKGPELLGSYVGESESHVRSVFQKARLLALHNQPQACILFFDELDSLAPRRGDQASAANVMDRVVATLFAELDRETSDGSFVFCIGATNRVDLLDPALLRPGRLDRLVYLGTSQSDQATILATQMRKLRLEGNPKEISEQLVPFLSANLTGADLSAIVSGALLCATERLCKVADEQVAHRRKADPSVTVDDVLSTWNDEQLQPVVTFQDLREASTQVVPSVTENDLQKYEQLREEFSAGK